MIYEKRKKPGGLKEKSFCFVFLLLLLLDLCLFYRTIYGRYIIENNNSSVALIQDDAMLQQHWKKMFGIIYISICSICIIYYIIYVRNIGV